EPGTGVARARGGLSVYSKLALARYLDEVGACFFLQAEDGIRYWSVTGVQTCALPIWPIRKKVALLAVLIRPERHFAPCRRARPRSEERRVGKECRSRGLPYQ